MTVDVQETLVDINIIQATTAPQNVILVIIALLKAKTISHINLIR